LRPMPGSQRIIFRPSKHGPHASALDMTFSRLRIRYVD
jgi:hypothetical protein